MFTVYYNLSCAIALCLKNNACNLKDTSLPKHANHHLGFRVLWSQITLKNITMKKFEMSQELPKCDTDMKWAGGVGKMELMTGSTQGYHKPSIC